MRLIDADDLLYEDIDCTDGRTYMVVHAPQIDSAPTAFDVKSVIAKFEGYKHQQSENEMLSDNGKWLVQRVIEECEKILKSAANATNGKIGG